MAESWSGHRRYAGEPIKTTEHGSAKYGPCEVCGNYCGEVFMAKGSVVYKGKRHSHCTVFGCKPCLESLPHA